MLSQWIKIGLLLILFLAAGSLFGRLFQLNWSQITHQFLANPALYRSPNLALQTRFNQMIYVQLPDGFAHHNLNDAFTLTGILKHGLFEDPMGTSAYMLSVESISAFYGQPDDFRPH